MCDFFLSRSLRMVPLLLPPRSFACAHSFMGGADPQGSPLSRECHPTPTDEVKSVELTVLFGAPSSGASIPWIWDPGGSLCLAVVYCTFCVLSPVLHLYFHALLPAYKYLSGQDFFSISAEYLIYSYDLTSLGLLFFT